MPTRSPPPSNGSPPAGRRRSWRGRSGSMLVALLTLAGVTWAAPWYPVSAAGSCIETQQRSPYAFTGVVVSTSSRGRVATVKTDTGATVEVVGTPSTGSAATSVDRSYEVGGRYEFHPTNGSSPYQDNACTATHLLSRGLEPSAPKPDPSAVTSSHWLLVGVGGLAMMAVVSVVAIRWRKRRRSATSTGP